MLSVQIRSFTTLLSLILLYTPICTLRDQYLYLLSNLLPSVTGGDILQPSPGTVKNSLFLQVLGEQRKPVHNNNNSIIKYMND
jgi:hypothetical protein